MLQKMWEMAGILVDEPTRTVEPSPASFEKPPRLKPTEIHYPIIAPPIPPAAERMENALEKIEEKTSGVLFAFEKIM